MWREMELDPIHTDAQAEAEAEAEVMVVSSDRAAAEVNP